MSYTKKRIRRLARNANVRVVMISLVSVLVVALYAGYMTNQRLVANPKSYRALLNLIGKVESNDNYNAYFGNARSNSPDFTNMSVRDVMAWQKSHIKKGNPSSAVGRYQIISPTLKGLVTELNIDLDQKFNQETQDSMAIALLERRGADAYVNNELSQNEFAANLAKEWAALPKITGKNPEHSYYAGDGLNAARAKSHEVLRAIEPISAK